MEMKRNEGEQAMVKEIMGWALACALLIGAGPFGLAEDADLEARLERLEKKLESLEKQLESKDAEVARLKERLRRRSREGEEEDGDLAPEERGPPAPFGDALDRMLEELEKRGPGWDFDRDRDWGLPGRRLDPPPPGPRSLRPPWGSRAFLGVGLETLAGGGVRIVEVVADAPAEEAGLEAGDVVAEIDGRAVSSSPEVVQIVRSKAPGDRMVIAVLRDGERREMDVTLGERPGPRWQAFPRGPSIPGRPRGGGRDGLSRRRETDAAGREDAIEVEVETRGGEVRVSLSAPGLYLSEDLARELGLDDAAHRKVEKAFGKARSELAAGISEMIRKGDGSVSTDAVAEKRIAAERAAREALARVLTREQLEKLERTQAEFASRSHISISSSSSKRSEPEEKRREVRPRRRRGAADRGEGTEF